MSVNPRFRPALIATLAFALPCVAIAKEPLYIAKTLEVAPSAKVGANFADCPFRESFGEILQKALHKDNGTFAPGKVPTPAGRSLRVRLVGFDFTGNGFIGHASFMEFEGTLYRDGKKEASFTDRVTLRTQGLMTGCAQLRSNLDSEAFYIAKWVRKPVDGQELKRWGE